MNLCNLSAEDQAIIEADKLAWFEAYTLYKPMLLLTDHYKRQAADRKIRQQLKSFSIEKQTDMSRRLNIIRENSRPSA